MWHSYEVDGAAGPRLLARAPLHTWTAVDQKTDADGDEQAFNLLCCCKCCTPALHVPFVSVMLLLLQRFSNLVCAPCRPCAQQRLSAADLCSHFLHPETAARRSRCAEAAVLRPQEDWSAVLRASSRYVLHSQTRRCASCAPGRSGVTDRPHNGDRADVAWLLF